MPSEIFLGGINMTDTMEEVLEMLIQSSAFYS